MLLNVNVIVYNDGGRILSGWNEPVHLKMSDLLLTDRHG